MNCDQIDSIFFLLLINSKKIIQFYKLSWLDLNKAAIIIKTQVSNFLIKLR